MSKKINIVHLIPSIGFGGGAENVVYNLCRTIDASRFQITLLYWGVHQDLADPIRATGAQVVKLPLKSVVSFNSLLKVASEIKRVKGDLLHTHFMDADLLGFLASKLAGIPMVMEVHSFPFPDNARHAWRYRLMSGGMRKIICVSRKVQEHVRQLTGIGEGKCEVIYNALDFAQFDARLAKADRLALRESLGVKADDIVVGNVSRLIADKGHEYLIKAMPSIMLGNPRVKLLIVGDGPLRGSLERLASDLGLGGRVVFAGKRTDVPELLTVMDIFVFPTFNEAFGICVLEGMAAAKPIIATDDAGIPEIITHEKSGLLVHPGDADAITGSLRRLLNDAALRQRLAENARRRVQDFGIDNMTDAYERLYAELAGA